MDEYVNVILQDSQTLLDVSPQVFEFSSSLSAFIHLFTALSNQCLIFSAWERSGLSVVCA